jgi:hypothetical protein
MGSRSPVGVTVVLAVCTLVTVSGWLLSDHATTHADALRTGGLAAGSVVALYALWLNDRRRKTEEARHEVERERYELERVRADRDRDRITDERFAKAIELLGHAADQVRVGAMHALAGLGSGSSHYTQTVLDVLCSYLRRPFDDDPNELQVRLTAQRLIVALLPSADSDGSAFDLDLTGAQLRYFDASGRLFGAVTLRGAALRTDANFSECRFTGPARFTDLATNGKLRCRNAVFADRVWFERAVFGDAVAFDGTVFAAEAVFREAVFAASASLRGVRFAASVDFARARFEDHADLRLADEPPVLALYNTLVHPDRTELPDYWSVEPAPGASPGRVRLTPAATSPRGRDSAARAALDPG